MGMYDSFFAEVECPYCKQKIKAEFQTKDLECMLSNFKIGDKINIGGVELGNGLLRGAIATHDECPVLVKKYKRKKEDQLRKILRKKGFLKKDKVNCTLSEFVNIIYDVTPSFTFRSHQTCAFFYGDIVIEGGKFVGIKNLRKKEKSS